MVREKSSASEMTGRNLGAARAKEEEEEYLLKSQITSETLCFFYMMVFVTIGLSLFGRPRYGTPPAPASDFALTVLYFMSISIELQVILAIVLSSSKPSPSRAPSRLSEWVVASAVWVFLAAYFFSYAMGLHAPEPNTVDLILAGIASAVNLAITVYSMLRRRVGV